MKTAIFGFQSSGKTSLFQALSGASGQHVNRALVKVPEPRLDPLVALYKPKKVTYSEIEFLDIPGGGAKGKSMGERILNEIRPYDCLLAVLDAFSGTMDAEEQRQAIKADLIIADLAVIEKRLEKMASDAKKNKNLVNPVEMELLTQAGKMLEEEKPLRLDAKIADAPELKGYRFLSAKPILYAWNTTESGLSGFTPPEPEAGEAFAVVSAEMEKELAELNDPEEKAMFLKDLGLSESVLDRVIKEVYKLLGLISFLTAGEKEVRSWPVRIGSNAQETAGVIHSDIQKGFIRAEVLGYDDFLACGDMKKAKEKGVLRLEGKEYIVRDGDIITFRFNV